MTQRDDSTRVSGELGVETGLDTLRLQGRDVRVSRRMRRHVRRVQLFESRCPEASAKVRVPLLRLFVMPILSGDRRRWEKSVVSWINRTVPPIASKRKRVASKVTAQNRTRRPARLRGSGMRPLCSQSSHANGMLLPMPSPICFNGSPADTRIFESRGTAAAVSERCP